MAFSLVPLAFIALVGGIAAAAPALPFPDRESSIVLIGNGFGERAQYDGYFETLLHLRFPDRQLKVRNLCFPGDTPAYRPSAGRNTQWAFDGGEKFRQEFREHRGDSIELSADEWLKICQPGTVLAFFGYNKSFDGPEGLANYEAELDAFVAHTQASNYSGKGAPKLVLVSPIAFEDQSATRDLPNGEKENANLMLYTESMRKVAEKRQVGFFDLFAATNALTPKPGTAITQNGFIPSEEGNRLLAPILVNALYGPGPVQAKGSPEALRQLVVDKGWFWRNDYRILNGVHVYGRRRAPFGTENYPAEITKLREMTANRDEAVWMAAQGRSFDLATADAKTKKLPRISSNYPGRVAYQDEKDSISALKVPEGFKIELLASEERFPDLSKPLQMSFDNLGRLWVSVIPSYPHYRPGDPLPNDKILIFEDTDGDGRVDKQTVFADKLHLPIGFDIAPEGV